MLLHLRTFAAQQGSQPRSSSFQALSLEGARTWHDMEHGGILQLAEVVEDGLRGGQIEAGTLQRSKDQQLLGPQPHQLALKLRLQT